MDVGLHKTFSTGRSTKLQVRIEVFSAFNWVNLGTPNTSQSSPKFARIITMPTGISPRVIQGSLVCPSEWPA